MRQELAAEEESMLRDIEELDTSAADHARVRNLIAEQRGAEQASVLPRSRRGKRR